MVLQFEDGFVDTVIMTGCFGKSAKYPNKKGRRFFATNEFMIGYWDGIPQPKIIGFIKP